MGLSLQAEVNAREGEVEELQRQIRQAMQEREAARAENSRLRSLRARGDIIGHARNNM